jgi:hypothetical protein
MHRDAMVAALCAFAGPAACERARRAWAEVRRHRDALVVLAFAAGVLAMILHWR